MKGSITEGLDKEGYITIHLYPEDVTAISDKLGSDFTKKSDIRNAIVSYFGSSPRERVKMSPAEKLVNSIKKAGLDKAEIMAMLEKLF